MDYQDDDDVAVGSPESSKCCISLTLLEQPQFLINAGNGAVDVAAVRAT